MAKIIIFAANLHNLPFIIEMKTRSEFYLLHLSINHFTSVLSNFTILAFLHETTFHFRSTVRTTWLKSDACGDTKCCVVELASSFNGWSLRQQRLKGHRLQCKFINRFFFCINRMNFDFDRPLTKASTTSPPFRDFFTFLHHSKLDFSIMIFLSRIFYPHLYNFRH